MPSLISKLWKRRSSYEAEKFKLFQKVATVERSMLSHYDKKQETGRHWNEQRGEKTKIRQLNFSFVPGGK